MGEMFKLERLQERNEISCLLLFLPIIGWQMSQMRRLI